MVFQAAPADVEELRSDERIYLSGVSAPGSGIVAGALVEGYIDERQLSPLVADFVLVEPANRDGNVVLHVLRDNHANPSPEHLAAVQALNKSWAIVAADLAEHNAPRENERVKELIQRAIKNQDGR